MWRLIVLLIVEKRVSLVAKIISKVSCYVPRKLWLVNQLEDLALDGYNIEMDLKETGYNDVCWIHLT